MSKFSYKPVLVLHRIAEWLAACDVYSTGTRLTQIPEERALRKSVIFSSKFSECASVMSAGIDTVLVPYFSSTIDTICFILLRIAESTIRYRYR